MSRFEKTARLGRLSQFIGYLMVLTLVGCGGQALTPVSAPATATPTHPKPTATPMPTTEPTPMIRTLELWLPQDLDPYAAGGGSQVLAQQLSDFSNTYPNLQVDVVVKKASGRGGLVDFMRTARDAVPSVLPDLVVLDASDLKTVAGSELIQPLDDFLAPSVADDQFPFSAAMGKVENQTVGAVLGIDLQHLAYRPALFDSPPISWTHVISAPGAFLFPAGGYDDQVNDATLIQYLGAGGKLTDAEGTPSLDKEVLVDVFDFYSRCITTTVIAPMEVLQATHVDQTWDRFKGGEGAMTAVRASRYWLEADETMAPAPIPTRTGQPVSMARGWALAIVTEDPDRQDSAMLLVEWLISPDHNALWSQAAGYLPGTRSALRLWSVSAQERAVLRNLLEAAMPPPRPPVLSKVGSPLQQALESVLNGQATPEEAAQSAVESLHR
ncbi:MAG: extracellular solute-binding protein [Anaerolineae bacterium]|jgi:ABC-type glycerol-3-phosphate transport system substrate-binding protein